MREKRKISDSNVSILKISNGHFLGTQNWSVFNNDKKDKNIYTLYYIMYRNFNKKSIIVYLCNKIKLLYQVFKVFINGTVQNRRHQLQFLSKKCQKI